MPQTTPEDITKAYRERFGHAEPEPFVPDGGAGVSRREIMVNDGEEEEYTYVVHCEMCPHYPSPCSLDCHEVRRTAAEADGVSVTIGG